MSEYFQVSYNREGNLWVADGLVMQPRNGVIIRTGLGLGQAPDLPLSDPNERRDATPATRGQTLLGGSGRNILLATTVVGIPSVMQPRSYVAFTGGYEAGDFVARIVLPVPVGGPESVIELDGVVMARLTGSLSIGGTYVATTAGRAAFNGGAAFNIVVSWEMDPQADPGVTVVYLSGGTAQDGIYQYTYLSGDYGWANATDTDWTLVGDDEGKAELRYLDNVAAIRPSGDLESFEGTYFSTPYGSQTYGEDGADWTAVVQRDQLMPVAGVVYVRIKTPSGTLSTVEGPFFAATLPSPATNNFCVRLAISDGASVVQDWSGAIMV